MDVYATSQIPHRAWFSDNSDESLSPCAPSVLTLCTKVERSKSNRNTLTTLTYRCTFL
jgi:hypothetical protein